MNIPHKSPKLFLNRSLYQGGFASAGLRNTWPLSVLLAFVFLSFTLLSTTSGASNGEDSDWEAALDADTPASYTTFIQNNTESSRLNEARARLWGTTISNMKINLKFEAPNGNSMVRSEDGSITYPSGTILTGVVSAMREGKKISVEFEAVSSDAEGSLDLFRSPKGICLEVDLLRRNFRDCAENGPELTAVSSESELLLFNWWVKL